MAVQKKLTVIPPSQGPLSGATIYKDNKKKRTGYRKPKDEANTIKPISQNRKPICFPSLNRSTRHISGTTSLGNTAENHHLNVDERLRLAKERREEHEKQLVFKELSWLQREERARLYYVKHLEERKMRLLEQRMKEDKRRSAVEEKRKLRLKEEQERCESAVRRTLEKSKRVVQNLGQNSRGRKPTNRNACHCLPLSEWEKALIRRLLTPTCSYLARSKSAVCQSGQEVSCYSVNTTTSTTLKAPKYFGPVYHRTVSVSSHTNNSHGGNNLVQVKIKGGRQHEVNLKTLKSRSSHTPTIGTRGKPAPKPRTPTVLPLLKQNSRRSVRRHSIPKQLELASVPEEEDLCDPTVSPGNYRPIRTHVETMCPPEEMMENLPMTLHPKTTQPETEPANRSESEKHTSRPSAGTTDPEEASRILAEKRRAARLLREKQMEELQQKEMAEKLRQEELQKIRETEQAQIVTETQQLIEEKKKREEEVQKHIEEEKACRAKEEAIVLQKQKQEEQALLREKEEQIKQEREKLFQKEMAARQERKKRLEEIMRRTRPEAAEKKSVPMVISGMQVHPKENTQLLQTNTTERVINLPVGTKSSHLGFNGVEDMVPVVAFKERRSLRTLAGLEEIQTSHRAEVI